MGKMATRAASLSGFLLFFVTCHAARDVAQCHTICIFLTRGVGDSHNDMKGAGMLVGNFKLNPLRRPTWAWANVFLTPKKDHFVTMFFSY